MSDNTKYYILYSLGMIFCLLPPVIAAVEFFPIWEKASPAVLLSGMCVSGLSFAVMACVALPPVLRMIRQKMTGKTPAAWLGFLIAALIFKMISAVVDALFVIFMIAALSNMAGSLLFRAAEHFRIRAARAEEAEHEEL